MFLLSFFVSYTSFSSYKICNIISPAEWTECLLWFGVFCLFFALIWRCFFSLTSSLICSFFKQGYVYKEIPGKCCGSCVQTSCVVKVPGFTIPIIIPVSKGKPFRIRVCNLTLCYYSVCISTNWPFLYFWQPSMSWAPPNDNCTKYDCQKVYDEFVVSVNKTTCPEFDADNCVPVSIIQSTEGHRLLEKAMKEQTLEGSFSILLLW